MYKFLLLVTLLVVLVACTPTAPTPSASCTISVTNAVPIYQRASAAADEFGMLSPS